MPYILNYIMKSYDTMIFVMIQARMGSSRLPGKVMKNVVGKPLLQHIIERLNFCDKIDKIIVITSQENENQPIVQLCDELNVSCFSGNENDVLDRYYQAAKNFNLKENDSIVRITADCPLIDPEIVDSVILKHIKGNYDYTTNTIVRTYPDGLDCEVFKVSILNEMWEKAKLKSEREHVTLFIKNNQNDYYCGNVESKIDNSSLRWTVDEKEDFMLISKIFECLYDENKIFLMNDILDLFESNPSLLNINNMYENNEGLKKSLENDEIIR